MPELAGFAMYILHHLHMFAVCNNVLVKCIKIKEQFESSFQRRVEHSDFEQSDVNAQLPD